MRTGTFSSGGYYAHRVTIVGSSMYYSAWYSEDGRLLSAEAFDSRNRPRNVKRDSNAWRELSRLSEMIRQRAFGLMPMRYVVRNPVGAVVSECCNLTEANNLRDTWQREPHQFWSKGDVAARGYSVHVYCQA